MHVHPDSIWQVLLHPSRLAKFPCSHYSVPTKNPSPQTGTQVQGRVLLPPLQSQPLTGPEQSPLHLSKLETSPSSQTSDPTFLPSPQIGLQVEGNIEVQVHPASTLQVLEHPSPFTVFDCSHSSEGVITPSPQTSTQTLGFKASPPEQE